MVNLGLRRIGLVHIFYPNYLISQLLQQLSMYASHIHLLTKIHNGNDNVVTCQQLYLLMQETHTPKDIKDPKKNLLELSSSNELPFVCNRQQVQQYTRKLPNSQHKTKNKKAQIILTNESERIKKQYMKLCKQIRYVYGVSLGKMDGAIHEAIGEKGCLARDRLIIKDSSCSKQRSKNSTEPSDSQLKFNSHFQFVIEDPNTKIQKFQDQNSSSNINLTHKMHRRFRQPNNFLVKRLQTDYLNVQKMKIECKGKPYDKDKNRTIDEQYQNQNQNHSDSAINIKKKKKSTKLDDEEESLINSNNSGYRREDILPVIYSISRAAERKMTQKQQPQPQKQKQSPTTKILKPRTIRSTSNTSKNFISVKRVKPFKIPFETYYYRDLLWKVNFSNSMMIEVPLEYEHRLRVFIGKGNNGGLIRGLVKRRIWFAIVDKIEDANFVWTQIKYLPYFGLQKSSDLSGFRKLTFGKDKDESDSIRQTGLLTQKQNAVFQNYFTNNCNIEERADQRFQHRHKYFTIPSSPSKKDPRDKKQPQQQHPLPEQPLSPITTPPTPNPFLPKTLIKTISQIRQQKMHNHLINNYIIGNKKALFKTMSLYYKKKDDYVFNYLPHTFHIEKGLEDENYFKFLRYYNQRNKESKSKGQSEQCTWIVKPGQYSNRGNGIKVCKTLQQIKTLIKTKQKYSDGTDRTYIVQSYIEKPLLYNRRKFDLRHYMMLTSINGIIKGYWYREGYVRTSSTEYSLATGDGKIHLTNDAVQKNMPDYGKYQKGNKISYDELHGYLMRLYGFKNYNFEQIMLPKMKALTTDIVRACSGTIDPNLHSNNFEIFGLDFMIDSDFNLWLIEVNTNPCLQLSCPLLASIIPKMVQNALQLTLDTAFPPPVRHNPKGIHYLKKLQQQNKFDLIYDSRVDGVFLDEADTAIDARLLNQEEETYEDQGEEWNQDD